MVNKKKNLFQKIALAALLTTNFVSPLNITQVHAQQAYNPYVGGYRNCTWTVWQLVYEQTGIALPGWHNAGQWAYDAANSGYTVTTTPAVNSIIVWSNHVAWVTAVSEDGSQVYIHEGGASIGYQERWTASQGPLGWQQFIGYIYLPYTDSSQVTEIYHGDLLDNAANVYISAEELAQIRQEKAEKQEYERRQKLIEEEKSRVVFVDDAISEETNTTKQEDILAQQAIAEADKELYGYSFSNQLASFAPRVEEKPVYIQGEWVLNSDEADRLPPENSDFLDEAFNEKAETSELKPISILGTKEAGVESLLILAYGSSNEDEEPSFKLVTTKQDLLEATHVDSVAEISLDDIKAVHSEVFEESSGNENIEEIQIHEVNNNDEVVSETDNSGITGWDITVTSPQLKDENTAMSDAILDMFDADENHTYTPIAFLGRSMFSNNALVLCSTSNEDGSENLNFVEVGYKSNGITTNYYLVKTDVADLIAYTSNPVETQS